MLSERKERIALASTIEAHVGYTWAKFDDNGNIKVARIYKGKEYVDVTEIAKLWHSRVIAKANEICGDMFDIEDAAEKAGMTVVEFVTPKEKNRKREVMKTAWQIRREAAKKYNCKVAEISMSQCLKMAWQNN